MSAFASRAWIGVLLYALAACDDTSSEPDASRGSNNDSSAPSEETGTREHDAGRDAGARDAEADARASEPLDAASSALDGGGVDARANDASADAQDASLTIACSVLAPTECPTPMPRYADVAPIFKARCAVCHGASWTGQWPLDTYRHVVDWEDSIRAHLLECTMPPLDSGVPMTNAERMQILDWIRCDTPQ